MKSYTLGPKYPGIVLTHREAQCSYYLTRGATIPSIAKILELSPRTVEFYFNNLKAKMSCHRKSELIEKILTSDLLANLDFQCDA